MFNPFGTPPASADFDVGGLLRRLGYRLAEAQYGTSGPINQGRPLADPQNQTANSLWSLYHTGRVVLGCVTDATAVAHAYRVQFEKGQQPLVAVRLSTTTCASSGVRDLTTIQPGSLVFCLLHEQLSEAVILGVLPPINTSAAQARAAVLFGSSRARVDSAHRRPLQYAEDNVPDCLAGRPYDATMGGEAGWIGPTGIRMFIDQEIATLGLDEFTGVTAIRRDQLLRLGGLNLQMWTAGYEREALLDQMECNDVQGWAPYPWEQMGLYLPTGAVVTEQSPATWQKNKPWLNSVEPVTPQQMPWHREREFHGYLGQGGKHVVQGPPVNPPVDRARYGDGLVHPGLFDQTVLFNGQLLMQSATGISIAKRPAIVSPTRKQRPEQPSADNPENYKFAGMAGGGPVHAITGDIPTVAADPGVARAAALMDFHVYLFNYAGVLPFAYHSQDWTTPDESELDYVNGVSCAVPPFNQLAATMYLSPEAFKRQLRIDHRQSTQDLYLLPSGLDFLPDGGVVLYGGCGEEIRFAGGSITDACPGDRWIRAARNVNVWGGNDGNFRFKNSADLLVTDGDLRIKSEKNLHMLSGNGGAGGMFFENRAVGGVYDFENPGELTNSSGIVFKAAKSDVICWASNIYMRTGGGQTLPGVIYLDADRGRQNVYTNSSQFVSYVTNGVFQYFGAEGDVAAANAFTQSACLLCSSLAVDQTLYVENNLVMKGNIAVAGGHIATEQGTSFPFVGGLADEGLARVYDALSQLKQQIEVTIPDAGRQIYSEGLTPQFYAEQKPGNDDVMTKAEFSLRTMADYRSQGFAIYEDRWQQLSRLAEQPAGVWEEKPVSFHGTPTYPYPGRENFDGQTLFEQDLTLFDATTGKVAPRGSASNIDDLYKDPRYATPRATSLNTYRILR